MTKMKRIASMVAATALAVSMVTAMGSFSVAAAVSTSTITITETTHTYTAYQIFVGNFDTDGKLQTDDDLALGNGVDSDAFYSALSLTGDNKTPANALVTLKNKTSAEVLTILKETSVLATSSTLSNGGSLSYGYYYIIDSDGTDTADILLAVNDATETINTKVGSPKIEKKIQEDDRTISATGEEIGSDTVSEKWNDCADYCIGEAVPFKIYISMPDNIANFDYYYLQIVDDLGAGFDAPAQSDITITFINGDNKQVALTKDWTYDSTSQDALKITFNDILNLIDATDADITVDKDTIIEVSYSATLNSNAVIGEKGNTNGAKLIYTKDTTYDGSGTISDKEETTEDGVVAFTYTTQINKVDGVTGQNLQSAVFKLKNADGNYATVKDGKFVSWDSTGTELTTDTDGLISIAGLDSGTYYIEEVAAPSGYNKLKDEIEIVISNDTMNNVGNWSYTADDGSNAYGVVKIAYEYDGESTEVTATGSGVTAGTVTAAVANYEGIALPETGGIGTKIFVGTGSALAIGAGVLLITKKRMKKEEE